MILGHPSVTVLYRTRSEKSGGNIQEPDWGTSAKMCVDAHVSRCATQTLALSVRYVLLRFRISILLGHTEIDDMNDCGRGEESYVLYT